MGRWSGKTCRLSTMMIMTASFFLVEIIVGYVTNSIALVADSFHMLSDVVALIVGFASVRISKWKTKRNTYGWQRAEVLGALVNSVFLLALCFSILVESVKRIVQVEEVDNPILLLVVGGLGLLINVFGLCLFGEHGHSHGGGHDHGHSHGGGHGHGRHSHGKTPRMRPNGTSPPRQDNGEGLKDTNNREMIGLKCDNEKSNEEGLDSDRISVSVTNASTDTTMDEKEIYCLDNDVKTEVIKHTGHNASASLNMRGVFLHVLGDALGSVVVIISALAIMFVDGDWKYYLDPAMSILMVMIILFTTIPLFKETAYILLQTVPRHVNVEAITAELKEIDGIAGVHECHIWQLAGRRIIASAHVHCKDIMEYMVLASKIKDVFHRAGIHSTTIQPEFPMHPDDDQLRCAFPCGSTDNVKCEEDTCCGPRKGVKAVVKQDEYNNSCNSDAALLLKTTEPSRNGHRSKKPNPSTWSIPIEMSPEGDEVVLDLSKTE